MKHFALPFLSSLLLAGCTLGPDFKLPEPPKADGYAAKDEAPAPADQRVALGKAIEANWWTGFQSKALDSTIQQALTGNLDVETARQRMAEAEEQVNVAEGALLPQVSLGAVAGRQKYGKSLFGPLNIAIPPFTYYTVGPSISFDPDLFGAKRRTREEKQALLDYQHHELDAAYQSLTAHVAAETLTLAAARDQIATVEAIIADDERNVALVQSAITAGSGTRVQLVSAQSQLAQDRVLLPDLRQQEAVSRHALAVLTGKAPSEWSPPAVTLNDFTLPGELPVSLPSELVHRRPDILAAEAQLHAASAAIGVATANLYPSINLTATVTQQALTPGGLFDSVSNAWSLAAGLTQPIFDGGRLSAEKRAAVDNYQAELASYRQTILAAFGDVADRLQALANDADRVSAQTAAQDTAAQSLDLARKSYAAGNSGILDVIDAQRRYGQAQLGLSRARAERLMDTAQLYLAMGGAAQ
ncbi:MAG TPA: efflux transporter outer membrane subunit [Rhizomicrobium sp.]|nr:efflux transporter outer membrane subunit [Rhizomicrobium sp.]